jgi:Fe(3+) dicitrate transport protein
MKHQDVLRYQNRLAWFSSIALLCGSAFSSWVKAQDIELPRIDIVGREQNASTRIPGTVDVINQKRMQELQPESLQDVLITVPGVNIRGDDGGLAPFLILVYEA